MPRRLSPSTSLHLVESTPVSQPVQMLATEQRKSPLARFEGKALIKIADAAAALEMSRATIYRVNADGRLPFVHEGRSVRVRIQDLEAYLDRMPAFDRKRAVQQS